MKHLRLFWYKLASGKTSTFIGYLILSILILLSFIYYLLLILRKSFYGLGFIKKKKLSCPVISVGNITVGGTGKTPMVEYLARSLLDKGKKVVVLSRGYGKIDDQKDDEALTDTSIIRLTGSDRAKLGEVACEKHSPDVIILDDGFQHWRLQRDIDIVMIDCLNPFGNKRILPAGILRERLSSLERATAFILTHVDLVSDSQLSEITSYLAKFNKHIIKSKHEPVGFYSNEESLDVQSLKGKRVWGFCGIGNPVSFKLMLKKLGMELAGFSSFPDHYKYREKDINILKKEAVRAGVKYLITTMKDKVKIEYQLLDVKLYALKINLVITEGNDKLENIIPSN